MFIGFSQTLDAQIKSLYITTEEGADFFKKDKSYAKALKRYLHLPKGYSFRKVRSISNNEGFSHEVYNQYYKGIKVDGAEIWLHFLNNCFNHANGEYLDGEHDLSPKITKDSACYMVKRIMGSVIGNPHVDTTSMLFTFGKVICMNQRDLLDQKVYIAYNFYVTDEKTFHEKTCIDARTGKVLNQLSNIMYNVRLAERFPENNIEIRIENPLADLPCLKAIVERFQTDSANQIKIWECSYLDSLKGYEVFIKTPTEHKSLYKITYILYNGKGECICSQRAEVDDDVDYFKSPLHYYFSRCQEIRLKKTKRIYQNH